LKNRVVKKSRKVIPARLDAFLARWPLETINSPVLRFKIAMTVLKREAISGKFTAKDAVGILSALAKGGHARSAITLIQCGREGFTKSSLNNSLNTVLTGLYD
jgi:hypothetical protein